MIKKNDKRKVRYEFFKYSGVLGTLTTQVNLKIENPASIKFVCVGPAFTGALINNTYFLSPCVDFTAGATQAPYELVLNNNINEIDITTYSIVLVSDCAVLVVCKYYVND